MFISVQGLRSCKSLSDTLLEGFFSRVLSLKNVCHIFWYYFKKNPKTDIVKRNNQE